MHYDCVVKNGYLIIKTITYGLEKISNMHKNWSGHEYEKLKKCALYDNCEV
jgi:hypothetical protein